MGAERKEYLGDGVYASTENGMVKLSTERGYGTTHYTFLEEEVFLALKKYSERAFALRG